MARPLPSMWSAASDLDYEDALGRPTNPEPIMPTRYTLECDRGRVAYEFASLDPIIGLARECAARGLDYRIYSSDAEGEYFPNGTQRWHDGLTDAEREVLQGAGVL